MAIIGGRGIGKSWFMANEYIRRSIFPTDEMIRKRKIEMLFLIYRKNDQEYLDKTEIKK